jgi:NhaA family Na+:H+ antiporter
MASVHDVPSLTHDGDVLAPTLAERAADRLLRPFQEFARQQVSGGLLLLACTVFALVWANSPWELSYEHLLHEPFGLFLGTHRLEFDLHHWINDGLMAVFFFAVGLEIKREFLVGELAERRKAMLPIAGAFGGMIVPALLYTAFNAGGPGMRGWGIPMATDIAFALGALVVLGSRVPEGLKVFLVALAIVDDLGAVLVIALFYTVSIAWSGLGLAFLFLGAMFLANRAGARHPLIYVSLGAGVWYGLLVSGVHATLAGVLSAMAIPARVRIAPEALTRVIRRAADAIDSRSAGRPNAAMHPERFATINVLTRNLEAANSPLQRFEHIVHPWVTFAILPIFALFNAGLVIDASAAAAVATPVPLGIVTGLVLGKPLGVVTASWFAVRWGWASLPEGVSWRQMIGTGCLAGIGFTMSLFISGLAFPGTGLESHAKLGILLGSVASAVAGITLLLMASSRPPAEAG